ncbi:MAG: helix-turn-helix domain-containing protein [Pseudomonadota bacterium]|uniref:response regulator transcription factor n=1 Tax=Phenylobacterium sp. SCN 70-31 TaxID=1660129 RepID=UPI0025CCE7CB|nr:helix-turn-helix domain-containing protein [Phenylobacterium sp. SCN 70-31]
MANQTDYARRAETRSFRPRPERDDFAYASRLITERQLECLSWVQEGKSATDIGSILGLSGRTVEKHIIKVCGHLGVKTRVQAVVRARELGLIAASAP